MRGKMCPPLWKVLSHHLSVSELFFLPRLMEIPETSIPVQIFIKQEPKINNKIITIIVSNSGTVTACPPKSCTHDISFNTPKQANQPTKKLQGSVLFVMLFHRWGAWGSGECNNLHKVSGDVWEEGFQPPSENALSDCPVIKPFSYRVARSPQQVSGQT